MFENLFRNTIEHAEGADQITVYGLNGGFAIEDNGCGIPLDQQNKIMEYGYTNSEEGTGLGLAIVREIVDAHDWEIEVKRGVETDGARFEITGLTRINPIETLENTNGSD